MAKDDGKEGKRRGRKMIDNVEIGIREEKIREDARRDRRKKRIGKTMKRLKLKWRKKIIVERMQKGHAEEKEEEERRSGL